jgi:hypothetical protein
MFFYPTIVMTRDCVKSIDPFTDENHDASENLIYILSIIESAGGADYFQKDKFRSLISCPRLFLTLRCETSIYTL